MSSTSIYKQSRLRFHATKYPTFRNCAGGLLLFVMNNPQLAIQPFGPEELPGAPEDLSIQKSSVIPQLPQILQHALSGHSLSKSQSFLVPVAGFCVPGFVGPQVAKGSAAGNGGLPRLTQILTSG
jgi:hypothetical protein